MTTIGFIGSGNIGGTVAQLAVGVGHEVVLSNSRGPDTLRDLVTELGPLARAGTREEASTAGELVVVSTPLAAYADLDPSLLAGKPVLDTGNYYPDRDGHLAALDAPHTSASDVLRERLPQSHVVRVFNNIPSRHLRELALPPGAEGRTALPIAGDDVATKTAVIAFLDSIGYDAVDAGSLAQAWRLGPDTPVYATPYLGADGWDGPARPVTADEVRAHLAAAT